MILCTSLCSQGHQGSLCTTGGGSGDLLRPDRRLPGGVRCRIRFVGFRRGVSVMRAAIPRRGWVFERGRVSRRCAVLRWWRRKGLPRGCGRRAQPARKRSGRSRNGTTRGIRFRRYGRVGVERWVCGVAESVWHRLASRRRVGGFLAPIAECGHMVLGPVHHRLGIPVVCGGRWLCRSCTRSIVLEVPGSAAGPVTITGDRAVFAPTPGNERNSRRPTRSVMQRAA